MSKEATSLFSILNGLRFFGVGTKVTRQIYKLPDTYWEISRVVLSKDQEHGKVYGKLIWNNKVVYEDKKITTALKKDWKLLELPNYKTFFPKENHNISKAVVKPITSTTKI